MRRFFAFLAGMAMAGTAQAGAPDGAAIFQQQCSACHQPNGQGLPGQFPPLARNPDIFLARDFPLRVVLFGMTGTIHVKGQTIQGAMPPLGEVLKDDEIAAVVNFVRASWGNAALRPATMAPVTPAMVAALRAQKQALADHVFDYRKSLKAAAKH